MAESREGLVSVIVPVYNRQEIVKKTIESILAQTYTNLEIVLINDGSTDDTLRVLQEYARREPNRIVVIDQQNAGQSISRNRGIEAARGQYIAFLDSDDTWAPTKLAEQIPLFTGNVGLVFCGVNDVTVDGTIVRTTVPEPHVRGDIHRTLLRRNRITGGTVVLARTVFDRVGFFDSAFRSAENYDMWLRTTQHFNADFVARPLMNYTLHATNMSADRARVAEGGMMILQKWLPAPPEDPALLEIYNDSYANYYLDLGAEAFARGDYREARRLYHKCREYVPGYRNSTYRLFRTYLGRPINAFLSRARGGTRNVTQGVGQ